MRQADCLSHVFMESSMKCKISNIVKELCDRFSITPYNGYVSIGSRGNDTVTVKVDGKTRYNEISSYMNNIKNDYPGMNIVVMEIYESHFNGRSTI